MTRKILSLFLALVLCLGVLPAASASREIPARDEFALSPAQFDALRELSWDSAEAVPAAQPDALGVSPMADSLPELIPCANYVSQSRVVGDDMPLDFVMYYDGSRALEYFVFVFQGADANGKMIGGTTGKIPNTGYTGVTVNWDTAGNAVGTYTIIYCARTTGANPQTLEETLVGFRVNLMARSIPLTDVALVNVETGKPVTSVNVKRGFNDLVPVTMQFTPSNTTADRYMFAQSEHSGLEAEAFAGFLLLDAKNYGVYTVQVSNSCKDLFLEVNVCSDDKGHSYGTPVPYEPEAGGPTCLEGGDALATCTKCNYRSIVQVPALGHDYVPGAILIPEDGDNWGTRLEDCSRCGKQRSASYHTCPCDQFSDRLDDYHWAHKYVDKMVSLGIMGSTGFGQFEPAMVMTRAQIVTMLYRVAGKPDVEDVELPFTDVFPDAWNYTPVVWGYTNGIVKGTSLTTFSPEVRLPRETFATLLYRYYISLGLEPVEGADLSVFPDGLMVSEYAKEGMAWAVATGIVTGNGTSLVPQSIATREQAATMFTRFINLIEAEMAE